MAKVWPLAYPWRWLRVLTCNNRGTRGCPHESQDVTRLQSQLQADVQSLARSPTDVTRSHGRMDVSRGHFGHCGQALVHKACVQPSGQFCKSGDQNRQQLVGSNFLAKCSSDTNHVCVPFLHFTPFNLTLSFL